MKSLLDRLPRGIRIVAVALLVTLAPIALAVLASLIGEAAGCSVNESGASPCMIAGIDAGGALNTLFTAGWLGVLVLPFSSLAIIAGMGIAIFDFANRKRL